MESQEENLTSLDEAFDRRMRAVFERALPIGDAPQALLRNERLRLTARFGALLCLAALLAVVVAGVLAYRPPELVREALAHERQERTLRGNFMAQDPPFLTRFGQPAAAPVPGLLQMAKPCLIADRIAYHMTTYLEGIAGGGMVTAIAFAQPVELPQRGGWWRNTYWQVIETNSGKPLLLIAENKKAIEIAAQRFV